MSKMIKYEFRKIVFDNKSIYLLCFVLLYTILTGIYNAPASNERYTHNRDIFNVYYESLQGSVTASKKEYIEKESVEIANVQQQIETVLKDYRNDKINDSQYIELKKEQNIIRDRTLVFQDISEYFEYVKQDNNREFIDEASLNMLIKDEYPLVFIIVMIIIVVLCFHQEDSNDMNYIILTTKIGKTKLLKAKIISLICIFTITLLINSIIEISRVYYQYPIRDLSSIISNSRQYAGTSFSGNFITMVTLSSVYSIIAIVCLVLITSAICMKVRNGIIATMGTISLYLIPCLLYGDIKWMYYLSYVGYFNPSNYFMGDKYNELGVCIFKYFTNTERNTVFMYTIIVVLMLLIFLFVKKTKLYSVCVLSCLLFILSGCTNQTEILDNSVFYNQYSLSANNEVIYNTVAGTFFNTSEMKKYDINRNPLDNDIHITCGYLYHQYYYFIDLEEALYTIKQLNINTFAQKVIFTKKLEDSDFFSKSNQQGKIKYIPQSMIVYNNSIIVNDFYSVNKIDSKGKEISLLEERVSNLQEYDGKLFYINDFDQLFCLDLETNQVSKVLDEIINSYTIHNGLVYYVKLKDQHLYEYNPIEDKKTIIIEQPVEFFQITEDSIYFVDNTFQNLYDYNIKSNMQNIKLDKSIYNFIVTKEKIYFYSMNERLEMQLYYYNDGEGCVPV